MQSNPNKDSKLVRLLSEYQLSKVDVNHEKFAERLGLLVDLSDSVALSESLRAIPSMSYNINRKDSDSHESTLVKKLLEQRSDILKSILKSFDPSAVFVQFRLPTPKHDTPIHEALNFDQYQRFYLLHQSEMDFKIEKIRANVRHKIASRSLKLAQLAVLDKTISRSMSLHTRKHFSTIPKILKSRFTQLYADYQSVNDRSDFVDNPSKWLEKSGWLSQFYAEMQQLLLAEFEVRLQPVIGLVEAYNEDIEKKS